MDILWYKQPAKIWEEALPIGNGKMGGMVYGNILQDRICLNQDTLWSGKPIDQVADKERLNKGRSYLNQVRECILNENYTQGRDIIEENILGHWGEAYLPLGDLLIETEAPSNITEYRRELDLNRGLVKVSCLADGNSIEREYFCSYPKKALIIHTDAKEPVTMNIRFTCQLQHTIKTEGNHLILEAKCPIHVEPDYIENPQEAVVYGEGGICCQSRLMVESDEGSITIGKETIQLKDVRKCTIYLTVADSFIDYKSPPCANYKSACINQMDEIHKLSVWEHLQIHLEDYQNLYSRMKFSLETDARKEKNLQTLSTDERLIRFEKGSEDEQLYALMVAYGRYLMIAASRPGSQAMNLQGIWNKNLRAVWSSNYTVNINTQMNYWPVLPCGMTELMEPLVDLIQDISEAGTYTAEELYGGKGWVSHHNIDLWRITTPVGGPWNRSGFSAVRNSMWPMSGAWLCRHLYDQYEYTLDSDFLKQIAVPIMKGSVLFLLDWLVELPDGSLGCVPSTSPENEFIYKGEAYGVSTSSAMDLFLIRELFLNYQKAMDTLGIKNSLYHKIAEGLLKLKIPEIGLDGRILEWGKEYEEAEVHHRHVSHLYGLYPSDLMPKSHLSACRKSLEVRGDEGTGWSLAWKSCLWARLGDSKRVYELLKRQLQLVDCKEVQYKNGGIYKNLFMAHPPFQIDANFGITAAILEMMVQCRNDGVYLLMALPNNWATGKIQGIAAKNGLLLDISWSDGELSECRVRKHVAGGKSSNKIYYKDKFCFFELLEGEERILTADDFR